MIRALKDGALSRRAERALDRAARDRNAKVAAGVVAGAGAAIVATKAALDRRGGDGAKPAEEAVSAILLVHCAGRPGRSSRIRSGGSMEQQMAKGSPIRHTGEAPADAEQVFYAV